MATKLKWPLVVFASFILIFSFIFIAIFVNAKGEVYIKTVQTETPPEEMFVYVSGTKFYLNAKPYYYAGTNNYYLWYKNITCDVQNPPPVEGCVAEVLDDAKALNLTVIRTWGFGDGNNSGNYWEGYAFQPSPGVYDENTFVHFDKVIKLAKDRGLRLIVTLVNNWDDFGGMNQYVSWCGGTSHDEFYTMECTRNLYKNYVNYFLNRVNTVTGVAYKNEPAIFAWELANEPRATSDPTGNKLNNWVSEMGTYIKGIDQNHMVTTGEEGFYKNITKGSGWRYDGSQGTNFIADHQLPSIDFASYHLYPDHWGTTYADSIKWIQEHVSDAHNVIGKPVILGEMGKIGSERDTYFEGWYNELETKGNNGDNFWILYDHTYTDYDQFGVYCPENVTTCNLITAHANYMNTFVPALPVFCGFHTIHTTYSDGSMTQEQRVAEMKEHFDCGSTNDHDTSLDQTEWTDLINQANGNNSDNNFTYFFGVEWTGYQHIHYITMNPSANQKDAGDTDFDSVAELAAWLSANQGIAQHNHPSGVDFSNPANSNETWISLIEMINAGHGGLQWTYVKPALDNGLHLGFSCGDDYHGGTPWTPSCYTGLANPPNWTRDGVYETLKKRHTWTAEDKILMDLKYGQDKIMGDIFNVNESEISVSYNIQAVSSQTITDVNLFFDGVIINVTKFSSQNAIGSFNINFADNNEHYVFIEAIQNNGKTAWSSPMYITFTYGALPVCGNNIKEPGEQCDGNDLGGKTCEVVGNYIGGNLSCSVQCTFDTAQCIENPCGNGYCQGELGENCNSCSADCISGSFAICGDGICHGSAWGETCSTCPLDCLSGIVPGGTCSACFKGKCDGNCNPTKESSTCADCNPSITYCCGNSVCEGDENIFSCPVDCQGYVPPVYSYCCGDDICQGSENVNNCQYDCGCSLAEECEDYNECTLELCNLGICENNAVTDNTLCSSGVCCAGICVIPKCSSNADCDDSNLCTIDSCQNAGTCSASCSNVWDSSNPNCQQATCAACFKGKCDGKCNLAQEGLDCLDCV